MRERRHIAQSEILRDVFVSFATENRRAAESAVQALESNGYSCWVAWRDIPESVPYAAAIVQGIRGARVILVLLTPESRASPHVLREVESAVAANRPILSVQMAGCLPGESLAYYLGPTQWLRNDHPELNAAPLVAAVSKLVKDAKLAGNAVDGAPLGRMLKSPAAICVATGLALAIVTEALAQLFKRYTLQTESLVAAQNRGVLLVLLGCFLWASAVMQQAIESRRRPFNPLQGQLVPTYAVVAAFLLILGLWVWSLATGVSPAFLVTGNAPAFTDPDGLGIPDFLTGTGDATSFWWKLQNVFTQKAYAWDQALQPLIVLLATAMVLSSVAICLPKLARSSAAAISIAALLPFLLVRCAFNGIGAPGNSPSLLYGAAAVCAALLSLWLHFVIKSRWPLSPP